MMILFEDDDVIVLFIDGLLAHNVDGELLVDWPKGTRKEKKKIEDE